MINKDTGEKLDQRTVFARDRAHAKAMADEFRDRYSWTGRNLKVTIRKEA